MQAKSRAEQPDLQASATAIAAQVARMLAEGTASEADDGEGASS